MMAKSGIIEEKPPHPVTPPYTSWLRKVESRTEATNVATWTRNPSQN